MRSERRNPALARQQTRRRHAWANRIQHFRWSIRCTNLIRGYPNVDCLVYQRTDWLLLSFIDGRRTARRPSKQTSEEALNRRVNSYSISDSGSAEAGSLQTESEALSRECEFWAAALALERVNLQKASTFLPVPCPVPGPLSARRNPRKA
jgi:hypothetical protein